MDGLIHETSTLTGNVFQDFTTKSFIFFFVFLVHSITNCSCQALTSNQSSGLIDYSGDRRASPAHDLLCSFLLTNSAET